MRKLRSLLNGPVLILLLLAFSLGAGAAIFRGNPSSGRALGQAQTPLSNVVLGQGANGQRRGQPGRRGATGPAGPRGRGGARGGQGLPGGSGLNGQADRKSVV